MFSYYGSKSKVIDYYPSPKHQKIIEPFAGSARYALKWFDRDVLLVDSRECVIKTWRFLQAASPADIMGLPEPKYQESIESLNLSEGERLLLGWLAGRGATHPRNFVQKFCFLSRDKANIAGQLYKIRHWVIKLGDYSTIANEKATWFIDPPYTNGGKAYRTKPLDYCSLSVWCQSRQGQAIVCENTKATWLPFWPVHKMAGARFTTTEAIWSNEAAQLSLFTNTAT